MLIPLLKSDLNFAYPEELVATQPQHPPRVMWVAAMNQAPIEISFAELLERIPAGDLLVINNTKVVKRRVFATSQAATATHEFEILFLKPLDPLTWQVLFPAKNLKIGAKLNLPMRAEAELIEKGRPQILRLSREVTESEFEQWGELPLPPYIQAAREERHNRKSDDDWYQTKWAKAPGSLASPTASLHFSAENMECLRARGVGIEELTLHVGLGTFLPVTSANLDDHQMHTENVEIPARTWQAVKAAQARGAKVWALGTTVARSLESVERGMIQARPVEEGGYWGETALFMRPGAEWKVIDRLLTNFHQPESTLLALVASFHSLESVKLCYQWAIQSKFRLFSYGDFSVWIK